MENGVIIYGLISLSLVEMIEVIRMIFGPLNPCICWFQMFWRNGPLQGALLELDAIIIFRVITQKNNSKIHQGNFSLSFSSSHSSSFTIAMV
jgi:hypothetical protein